MTIISLKGRNRVSSVFQRGTRFKAQDATLLAAYDNENSISNSLELLVVIRKKTVKKAVVRNRIRRLVRESIRLFTGEYAASNQEFPIRAIIVLWNFPTPRRPALMNLQKTAIILRPLFDRACKYRAKII